MPEFKLLHFYLQGVSGDAVPDQAVTAETTSDPAAGPVSAGQTNVAPTGQAGVGAAGGQAGPSATAAHEEKAERAEGDSHTGKSGGGGAAAAEGGKGKAEKSKSRRAAKAQLVNPSRNCSLIDSVFVSRPPDKCMSYRELPAASQSPVTQPNLSCYNTKLSSHTSMQPMLPRLKALVLNACTLKCLHLRQCSLATRIRDFPGSQDGVCQRFLHVWTLHCPACAYMHACTGTLTCARLAGN